MPCASARVWATCTRIRSTTRTGFDAAHVGYVYAIALDPGQTAALMTFVVKGVSEVSTTPRGGYPIPRKDALLSTWSAPEYAGADKRVPAPGGDLARVTDEARRLVAAPDLRGLTPRQRGEIVNWTLPRRGCSS